MRGQTRLIAALIVVSCCVRFGMAAVGYVDPAWLLQYLGAPPAQNLQGPYVVRVWAIRDIVLAVLVLTARRDSIRALLLACVVIDCTDVLSARLSHAAGLFNAADTQSLVLAAVAAIVPETAALLLMRSFSPPLRGMRPA